jgi:hypothetical protein
LLLLLFEQFLSHLRHSFLKLQRYKLLQVLCKVRHTWGILLKWLSLREPRGRRLGRFNSLNLIKKDFVIFGLGGSEGENRGSRDRLIVILLKVETLF